MDKGTGSGSGIFPDPDPGDPKRPDPTGSGSATLLYILKITLHCQYCQMLRQEEQTVHHYCYAFMNI